MGALNTLSAVEAARQIAAGKIKSEALVRDCLERIAAREGEVQAWEHIDEAAALAQARAADSNPGRGLLQGVPVGVKDLIDTLDRPTGYGSPVYAGHRPAWDAPCVALTRAAGGIVLGKTVTTEFANMHPNKTRNPHNPAHTPGGSSSGSAAAVADFMVPLAFGTQTAGSIIRPASYCGVVGYKPSFGLISRVGVKALSDTLDTVGTLARSVPDAAYLAAAVSGRRQLIIEQPWSGKLRIGICRTYEWKHALPETVAALGDLIRAGKIRYFGLSNYRGWRIAEVVGECEAQGVPMPVVCQPYFNLMNRMPEVEILPACDYYGIGVASYSPVARGVLTGKYAPGMPMPEGSRGARGDRRITETELREESFAVAQKLREHAQKTGRTLLQLALAWLWANRIVSSVIAGPRTVEQWDDYVKAIGTAWSEEDEALVDSLVPPGYASTFGYNDPQYPFFGRIVE